MSGNCASGIAEMAMRPASVMTMATTMAKRGRSMKMFENIARAVCSLMSGSVFRNHVGRHHLARTHFLDAVDDDAFTLLEPVRDFNVLAVIGTGGDAPLLDFLVVADDEHIVAGLVEQHGGLRDE